MDIEAIESEIDFLVSRLVSLRELVRSDSPKMPTIAVEKMNEGICLYCDEKILEGEPHDRGVHNRCYQKIRRNIRIGETTETDEIEAGRFAPKQQTGRPSTFVPPRQIETKAEVSPVDVSVAPAAGRKIPAKASTKAKTKNKLG